MKDTRFIKTIRLRNLLSFGPESEEIELKPLNVLIGPNASGKSNFIDAISILQATPRDISTPFREGGGAREWIWKGDSDDKQAAIETTLLLTPYLYQEISLNYRLAFRIFYDRINIDEEIIKNEESNLKDDFLYQYQEGKAKIKKSMMPPFGKTKQTLQELSPSKDFNPFQSILSQRQDPFTYSEITGLGRIFGSITIYRNWYVGLKSTVRLPQQTDLPSDFLLESLNNFALIVNDLKERRETKKIIVEKLGQFYNDFDDFKAEIKGGTIQISFYEKGLKDPIPATRLSDGTLRFLSLLMILCHPEPPPLICIEEPEIGLHPDIMPTIADLLIEASKRTQLIVTTHSDVLVSALSETPESVLVCEHDEAGSHLRRLDEKKLKVWLEDYSLGELWLKGEIGGNRW